MSFLGSINKAAKEVLNGIKDFNKDQSSKIRESVKNGDFVSAFSASVNSAIVNSIALPAGIFAAEAAVITDGIESLGDALGGTAASKIGRNAANAATAGVAAAAQNNAANAAVIGGNNIIQGKQLQEFLEKFEESQKTDSEPKAKRKAPSFKRNPNYKGSIKEIISNKDDIKNMEDIKVVKGSAKFEDYKNVQSETMDMRYYEIEDGVLIKKEDIGNGHKKLLDGGEEPLRKYGIGEPLPEIDKDKLGDFKNHKYPKEGLKL